jgi:hypothetical protein
VAECLNLKWLLPHEENDEENGIASIHPRQQSHMKITPATFFGGRAIGLGSVPFFIIIFFEILSLSSSRKIRSCSKEFKDSELMGRLPAVAKEATQSDIIINHTCMSYSSSSKRFSKY